MALTGWPDFQPRVSPANQDDLLFDNINLPVGTAFTATVTLPAYYVGLQIVAAVNPASTMQISLTPSELPTPAAGSIRATAGGLVPETFIFPARNLISETVQVTLIDANGVGGGALFVFGLRSLEGMPLRHDGRAYPIGDQTNTVQLAAAGFLTLIPAPVAPFRILLKHLTISVNAVNCVCWVSLVIRATGSDAMFTTWGVSTMVYTDPGGLLLFPGQPIVANQANAGSVNFVALYDVVI